MADQTLLTQALAQIATALQANLTVLLATCLQHAGDNPILQALIGDALNQAEADL
jgi:hypothetical protein